MADLDRFLILDTETVRDAGVLAHFLYKVQAANMPPPIANRIVAISYLSGFTEGRDAVPR
jgi:hypothetical protein